MVVVAACRDLEIAPCGAAQRVEKVSEEFGRNVTYALAAEFDVPFEIDAPAEIYKYKRPAVVHGSANP